jgi:hypothetical protein
MAIRNFCMITADGRNPRVIMQKFSRVAGLEPGKICMITPEDSTSPVIMQNFRASPRPALRLVRMASVWTNEAAIRQWDAATTRAAMEAVAEGGDFAKRHLVNPTLLRLPGDVRGRRVLDA